jgi:hypothetical protein
MCAMLHWTRVLGATAPAAMVSWRFSLAHADHPKVVNEDPAPSEEVVIAEIISDKDIISLVRSRFSYIASEEVKKETTKARNEISLMAAGFRGEAKRMVSREVTEQCERQVRETLSDSPELKAMFDDHLIRVEESVTARARQVLDKLVEEEKYQEIDGALRRSLEASIQSKLNQSLVLIAGANTFLFLCLVFAASSLRKP